jgi:hypothetical protein
MKINPTQAGFRITRLKRAHGQNLCLILELIRQFDEINRLRFQELATKLPEYPKANSILNTAYHQLRVDLR